MTSASAEGEPEKKKRRQNVACDACKLRRVKCDLLALLNAQTSTATPAAAQPPLHVLVARHPDVACSNCISKGLRCTTRQITHPARPTKGGRRIEEARKTFGADEGEASGSGEAGEGSGGAEAGPSGSRDAQGHEDDYERSASFDANVFATPSMPADALYGGLPAADAAPAGMYASNAGYAFHGQAAPPFLDAAAPLGFEQAPVSGDPYVFGALGPAAPSPALAPMFAPDAQTGPAAAPAPAFPSGPLPDLDLDWLDQLQAAMATPGAALPAGLAEALGAAPDDAQLPPFPLPEMRVPPPRQALDIRTPAAADAEGARAAVADEIPPRQRPAHAVWNAIVNVDATADDLLTPEGVNRRYGHWIAPAAARTNVPIAQAAAGFYRVGAAGKGADGKGADGKGADDDPAPSPVSATSDADLVYDPRGDKFVRRIAHHDNWAVTRHAGYSGHANARSPYSSRSATPRPGSVASHALAPRKRARLDDDGDVLDLSMARPHDPWRLWSDDDAVVRWSRCEEVGERLADRTLGYALSSHLVRVYFQAVHLNLPALSPETFYLEWRRAGERPDRMTPAQEALCAVVEAWAARYSDNPVILGLDPSKAGNAPKVIQENGIFMPGTQARAHWGRAREHACHALLQRARKLMDQHGVLRKPTVTGVQALIVYSHLLHMSNMHMDATEHAMETRLVHAAMVEQMDQLELMWQSAGWIPIAEGEMPVSVGQMRMKQRRLFWTMIMSDAFWAAANGQAPKVPEEELDSSREWLRSVEDKLPASTFKALAFFMSSYHRLATTARHVARRITGPARRPGTVVVDELCTVAEAIWREVKKIYRDISARGEEELAACDSDLLGFSPVNYIAVARSSCPIILLIMHQAIRDQLDFRKSLNVGHIADPAGSPPTSEVALLQSLYKRSVETLLEMGRSQIVMFEVLLPTGIIQSAVFMRNLIATSQFLSQVPTVEQGYPDNTPGGHGWTWAAKQREVGVCVDALYQLGWAWGDIAGVLDDVMLAMERMQPAPAEIQRYAAAAAAREPSGALAGLKTREVDTDRRLYAKALTFWPPTSVPELVDRWANDGRPAISPGSSADSGSPEADAAVVAAIAQRAQARGGVFAALPNNLAGAGVDDVLEHVPPRPAFLERMGEARTATPGSLSSASGVRSGAGSSQGEGAYLPADAASRAASAQAWDAWVPKPRAVFGAGQLGWDAPAAAYPPQTSAAAAASAVGVSSAVGVPAPGPGPGTTVQADKVFNPAGFWLVGTDDAEAAAAQSLAGVAAPALGGAPGGSGEGSAAAGANVQTLEELMRWSGGAGPGV